MILETPDLSKEFYPQPKKYKEKKEPKPLKKTGKRTEAWLVGQPKLKELFKEKGIVSCEIVLSGCKGAYLWGFAHVQRRGRYDLIELTDPHHVVFACQACHSFVDDASKMPKEKAEKLLAGIVASRGW